MGVVLSSSRQIYHPWQDIVKRGAILLSKHILLLFCLWVLCSKWDLLWSNMLYASGDRFPLYSCNGKIHHVFFFKWVITVLPFPNLWTLYKGQALLTPAFLLSVLHSWVQIERLMTAKLWDQALSNYDIRCCQRTFDSSFVKCQVGSGTWWEANSSLKNSIVSYCLLLNTRSSLLLLLQITGHPRTHLTLSPLSTLQNTATKLRA